MQHARGATKELAQSLRKTSWLIPRPWSPSNRQVSGPSSLVLFCSLEIFFAVFGVALIFQNYPALKMSGYNFASWHSIFALLVITNSMWLIYNGIRREYSRATVTPALYIAYGAYLTYPLAITENASTVVPWCTLIGLYGLITPITTDGLRSTTLHSLGFGLAYAVSVAGSSWTSGLDIQYSEAVARGLFLLTCCLLLGFFFCAAYYYTEKSDNLYAETLSAQLQLTRSRDQSHSLQEFDKLVHDNVMAALLDASRTEGPIADRTRALAQRAIGVLEDESERFSTTARPSTFQSLTEQIAVGVAPWNSRLRFVENDESDLPKADPESEIPSNVARAFTHAVTEAVSNSARHSGTRTTQISIRTEMRRPASALRSDEAQPYIFCTVLDHGQGFNMKNLDMSRMGVRVSMLRSMEEVGGRVTIKSAPYRGTRVTVQWPGEL